MIKSSDSDKWRFPVEQPLRDLHWGPQRPEKIELLPSSSSCRQPRDISGRIIIFVDTFFIENSGAAKKHRNRESYHVQYLGCLFAQHFFLLLKAKHIFDKKPFVPLLLLRRRKKMFLGQRKNLLWAFFVQ